MTWEPYSNTTTRKLKPWSEKRRNTGVFHIKMQSQERENPRLHLISVEIKE